MEISEEKIEQVCVEAFDRTIAAVNQLVQEARTGENPLRADEPAVVAYLEHIYKINNTPVPKNVVVASGLLDGRKLAGDGGKEFGYGVARLSQLVYYREGLALIGDPPDSEVEIEYAFATRAYDLHAGTEGAVLVPYPSIYETDSEGELHSATGPAVAWANGEQFFYWHGNKVPREVIVTPELVTRELLESVTEAERRRACFEALGMERVIQILGLSAVHSWTDDHGLGYELYKSKEGACLRMQSPPLQDGSQPWYVEPVHESCETCAEALAWRATGNLQEEVTYEIVT